MKNRNTIHSWRIKKGAYKFMSLRLNYPEQVDQRMDNQICRITVTDYTVKANIRSQYQTELEQDHLWQVEVLGIKDRQFLVLQSLLIDLEEDIVVLDETGNKLFG